MGECCASSSVTFLIVGFLGFVSYEKIKVVVAEGIESCTAELLEGGRCEHAGGEKKVSCQPLNSHLHSPKYILHFDAWSS